MNFTAKFTRCAAIAIFVFLGFSAFADVRLPQLVANHMVLQRDAKLKIWGWATAGEKVVVIFNGKKGNAVAGADCKWLLTLPEMKAGGPYTMVIKGNNTITLDDILLGDVWFCSGQSNMVLRMEAVKEQYPDDVASADFPQIRNFYVRNVADFTPTHDELPSGAKWTATTPTSVLDFSAASFYFARQLYLKYHVPIGIISSGWDGSAIEPWISTEGYKGMAKFEDEIKTYTDTAFINRMARGGTRPGGFGNRPQVKPDKGTSGPTPWYAVDYAPENWHHFWLPGYWNDQGVKDLNGIVWFRKEVNVPASMTGSIAHLYLSRIADADAAYINGVQVGSSTNIYVNRRYTVPANLLKPGKNLIVIKVTSTIGKGGFLPDKDYSLNAGNEKIDLRGDWEYKVGQVLVRNIPVGPPATGAPVFAAANTVPTGIYNTMVAPATNYAIKGFLWYQGETNAGRGKEYGQLLPALIKDWRNKWQLGNLPFIYVQLPNYMEANYSPGESGWAELRESERKTLTLPNTGMAVTIDVGNWNELHPLDKKDVGIRLALWAEHLAYGAKDLVYTGPLYESQKIDGNKVTLSFTNIGGGLVTKGSNELSYFSVAGADGKYAWAKAKIEGDKVVVWNDNVPNPVSVRYAWADNPDGANLYNKEGLPASPFETKQ